MNIVLRECKPAATKHSRVHTSVLPGWALTYLCTTLYRLWSEATTYVFCAGTHQDRIRKIILCACLYMCTCCGCKCVHVGCYINYVTPVLISKRASKHKCKHEAWTHNTRDSFPTTPAHSPSSRGGIGGSTSFSLAFLSPSSVFLLSLFPWLGSEVCCNPLKISWGLKESLICVVGKCVSVS